MLHIQEQNLQIISYADTSFLTKWCQLLPRDLAPTPTVTGMSPHFLSTTVLLFTCLFALTRCDPRYTEALQRVWPASELPPHEWPTPLWRRLDREAGALASGLSSPPDCGQRAHLYERGEFNQLLIWPPSQDCCE